MTNEEVGLHRVTSSSLPIFLKEGGQSNRGADISRSFSVPLSGVERQALAQGMYQ